MTNWASCVAENWAVFSKHSDNYLESLLYTVKQIFLIWITSWIHIRLHFESTNKGVVSLRGRELGRGERREEGEREVEGGKSKYR